MGTSDFELMQSIAQGDQAAFAAFYDRHAARVLGLLHKWMADRADVEDVLQEIFWQVWLRAAQYDPARAAPGVWLVLIARSRALDSLRRHRPPGTPANLPEPVSPLDPSSALERDEASRLVHQALAQLPEEQRTALVLTFYEGMTQEQVARCQAIPLGTAKTRIRLGMNRLRLLLGDGTSTGTAP